MRNSNQALTLELLAGGKVLSASHQVISLDIVKTINRIPHAVVVLRDGHVPSQKFRLSDRDFAPGEELEIRLGPAEGKRDTLFKGLITRHVISGDRNSSSLRIELRDTNFKLTGTRKNRIFENMKDKQLLQDLISGINISGETEAKHNQMIQYASSDWDFLMTRAEANGFWVLVDDGKIKLLKPELADEQATFKLGQHQIYAFELDNDITYLAKSIRAKAWNVADQKDGDQQEGSFSLGDALENKEGPYAKGLSIEHDLVHGIDTPDEEIKAWADSMAMRGRMSLLRGFLRVDGNSELKPGDTIKLDGFGDRFNGKTLISGIRHQYSITRDWRTELQVGLGAASHAETFDVDNPPAAGLLPAVNGLLVGTVDAFEKDDQGKFRVRVKVPALGGIIWARLTSIFASKEKGVFFRPEKDDEVVLGFFNDDPRQAVILGSMHNPQRKPPLEVEKENKEKGIVLEKGKMQLHFHEQDKTAVLGVSDKTLLNMKNDDSANLKISDNDALAIEKSNGITAKTQQKINAKAEQDTTIGGSKIEVTATQEVSILGPSQVEIQGGQVNVK